MSNQKICPVEDTLNFFNRKWTLCILMDMFLGSKHFSEFKQSNPSLSNHILSNTLQDLVDKGLIEKIIKTSSKNSTEYRLTSKGLKVNKILYELASYSFDELELSKLQDYTKKDILNQYKDALNVN